MGTVTLCFLEIFKGSLNNFCQVSAFTEWILEQLEKGKKNGDQKVYNEEENPEKYEEKAQSGIHDKKPHNEDENPQKYEEKPQKGISDEKPHTEVEKPQKWSEKPQKGISDEKPHTEVEKPQKWTEKQTMAKIRQK